MHSLFAFPMRQTLLGACNLRAAVAFMPTGRLKSVGFAVVTIASLILFGDSVNAAPIYLNFQNTSVSLGSTMDPEPFGNQTTAISLANVIDAPSATASENHISPTTHVWVSGGPLELDFAFNTEYNLTTLHFWNYFEESFDVDNVTFTFFNSSNSLVGNLNTTPALGGSGGNPIFAQDYALSFPSNVQFVNAVLTGTNAQVDFNNIGFTGERSTPSNSVPEPITSLLLGSGLALIVVLKRRLTA